MKTSGTFNVSLKPVETHAKGVAGVNLARMTIDKTFEGGLQADSKGEMLSAMTAVQGSAGYVAIEQVQGRLDERSGSFVLQHFGTMAQGKDELTLKVVPDSGSDELTGLSGEMSIKIENGTHYYEFEYSL